MTKKDTKEALLEAGLQLFAEKGFDGTTVHDIAKAADVNISLISYHFDGKEGLYQEGLKSFAENRIQISRLIFTPTTSFEDFENKMRLWIGETLKAHLEQDYCTRIIHRDIMLGNPVTLKVFEETFLKGFYIIRDFISAAQEKNILRKDMDAHVTTELIFGAIMEIPKMDMVRNHFFKRTYKNEKDRLEIIDHFIRVFLKGLAHSKNTSEGKNI